MTRFTRTFAVIAAAGLVATGAAAPALAGKGPAKVTMSAKSLEASASRLCMPKTVLGAKVDRALPATICQSRSDWEAAGVTFVAK